MADKKVLPPRLPSDKPIVMPPKNPNLATSGSSPMSNELKGRKKVHVSSSDSVREKAPVLVLSYKQKKFIIALVSIILSIALVTGLVFLVLPKPTRPADIYINFEANVDLEFEEIVAPGQTHKVMPGDSYNAKFNIKSTDDEGSTDEVYVRVRLFSIVEDNFYPNIFTFNVANNNWYIGADGYLYLKQTLKANDNVEFCNKLNISKETGNYFQGRTILVNFEADCLQAGSYSYQAITEEWPTAPYEWKAIFYGNRD